MTAPALTRWIYDFADGSRDMRELLGGKGANVAEMMRVLGPHGSQAASRSPRSGDLIAIDGTTGVVTLDDVPLVTPAPDARFGTVLEWAGELSSLGVRANADTPEDARRARRFGGGGIGLCRTERMFRAADRQPTVPLYVRDGIIERSPFGSIDEEGVGALVQLAVERGRSARPGLEVGICGEHGGDPRSIHFFHRAGLDCVSCSPFRVPIARVAAAQAAVAS